MTNTDLLRRTIEPKFRQEDIDLVCDLLKKIFIDDKENCNQFNPKSKNFIKHPGWRMRKKIQNFGFELISEGVVLEKNAYVFTVEMINPDQTSSRQKIVIDYWRGKVYPAES